MQKIGILTYHTGYNYGASLQAYALQTTIKKWYPETKIINFETLEFLASREMFSRKPKRMKEFIKIFTRVPYKKSLKRRVEMFDDFTNNVLDVSALYRTEQEVIDHATDYDCIVCGSDQVWNMDKDLDAPAANLLFYLPFEKKQKRVAYAPSFGKWVKKAPEHEDEFMPWLKQFDAISVRETSGVEYLRSKGLDAKLALDPTVLLDKEDYDKIATERLVKDPYILLFSWNGNKDTVKAAKAVAKKLKKKLLTIVAPPRTMFSGVKRKLDVGPREFLSMIKYADFVVTNSFHGTAFSMTYEKPFISVYGEKPDPRMESLLKQLNLDDHLIQFTGDVDVDKYLKTDYSNVQSKKAELRKESLDYLKNALEVE